MVPTNLGARNNRFPNLGHTESLTRLKKSEFGRLHVIRRLAWWLFCQYGTEAKLPAFHLKIRPISKQTLLWGLTLRRGGTPANVRRIFRTGSRAARMQSILEALTLLASNRIGSTTPPRASRNTAELARACFNYNSHTEPLRDRSLRCIMDPRPCGLTKRVMLGRARYWSAVMSPASMASVSS